MTQKSTEQAGLSVALPLQQGLRERATMFRYTYTILTLLLFVEGKFYRERVSRQALRTRENYLFIYYY